MIVLTKKQTVHLIGIVLIFLFAIVYITVNSNTKGIKTVETVALPVNNKVIIIDAGHGVPDEGAQSTNRNNRS